jgi:hypothetical protein
MREIGPVGGLHERPIHNTKAKISAHVVNGKTVIVQFDFDGPDAADEALLMFDRISLELKRGYLEIKYGPFDPKVVPIVETEHR